MLSRDPTKGDPKTIHRIKVTETIKEGSTVFRLTPEEARKTALMSQPAADGVHPFSRFLKEAAVYRDSDRLPPYLRQPEVLAVLAKAPHDSSCVVQMLNDLMLSMVQPALETERR